MQKETSTLPCGRFFSHPAGRGSRKANAADFSFYGGSLILLASMLLPNRFIEVTALLARCVWGIHQTNLKSPSDHFKGFESFTYKAE
jgi:hypothetical protein